MYTSWSLRIPQQRDIHFYIVSSLGESYCVPTLTLRTLQKQKIMTGVVRGTLASPPSPKRVRFACGFQAKCCSHTQQASGLGKAALSFRMYYKACVYDNGDVPAGMETYGHAMAHMWKPVLLPCGSLGLNLGCQA